MNKTYKSYTNDVNLFVLNAKDNLEIALQNAQDGYFSSVTDSEKEDFKSKYQEIAKILKSDIFKS